MEMQYTSWGTYCTHLAVLVCSGLTLKHIIAANWTTILLQAAGVEHCRMWLIAYGSQTVIRSMHLSEQWVNHTPHIHTHTLRLYQTTLGLDGMFIIFRVVVSYVHSVYGIIEYMYVCMKVVNHGAKPFVPPCLYGPPHCYYQPPSPCSPSISTCVIQSTVLPLWASCVTSIHKSRHTI